MMIKTILNVDSIVRRKRDLPSVDLGDEIALLNIESGKYFGLGVQGSCIWKLMENDVCINEIVLELVKKYDVDTKTCEVQTVKFVNSLSDENLCDVI